MAFDHNKPFQTKCGWKARKLGVLNRTAFPLVVAVANPAFGDKEELHAYPLDGTQPTNATSALEKFVTQDELGCVGGALSLVNVKVNVENVDDDDHPDNWTDGEGND